MLFLQHSGLWISSEPQAESVGAGGAEPLQGYLWQRFLREPFSNHDKGANKPLRDEDRAIG
jgi:hypothetical protein